MTRRLVVLGILLALTTLGVVMVMWVTGMSLSALADRVQWFCSKALENIRKSDRTSRVMVLIATLLVLGILVIAKSIRRT